MYKRQVNILSKTNTVFIFRLSEAVPKLLRPSVVDIGSVSYTHLEKYLMKKPNEDIYVFEEDIEE